MAYKTIEKNGIDRRHSAMAAPACALHHVVLRVGPRVKPLPRDLELAFESSSMRAGLRDSNTVVQRASVNLILLKESRVGQQDSTLIGVVGVRQPYQGRTAAYQGVRLESGEG